MKETDDVMEGQYGRPQRKVSITEHVIASIAGMAAAGVDGISSLRGNVADNLKVFLGDERGRRGVFAHVEDDVVTVTLYVSVQYGYPIQDVARTLQSHVKREIEEMAGYRVDGVHIYVSDLTLPEGAWPQADEEQLDEAGAAAPSRESDGDAAEADRDSDASDSSLQGTHGRS